MERFLLWRGEKTLDGGRISWSEAEELREKAVVVAGLLEGHLQAAGQLSKELGAVGSFFHSSPAQGITGKFIEM